MRSHPLTPSVVEMLPSRLLLATEVTYSLEDGILTLIGTENKENINVRTDLALDVIQVYAGSRFTSRSYQFPREEVAAIRIWTGDQGDVIDCSGTDLPITVYAGAGNDTVFGSSAADEIHGGAGHDMLRAFAGNDTVYGGAGWDNIRLGSGDDVAFALADGGYIEGGRGSDELWGGEGYDNLYGQKRFADSPDAGVDSLHGEGGRDILWAGSGPALLDGGDDRDALNGGPSADTLFGGTGDDELRVQNDDVSDELSGGDGNDRAYIGFQDTVAPDVERFALPGGEIESFPFELAISNMDGVITVHGTNDADEIIVSSDLTDVLVQLNGFRYSRPIAELLGIVVGAYDGADLVDCSSLALPVEVFGGHGDDTLVGGSAADEMHGGMGIDDIQGLAGADTLFGGADDDRLDGGADGDSIHGRAGSDSLLGGDGDDLLYAGSDPLDQDTLDGGTGDDSAESDEDDVLIDVESVLA